MNIVTVSHSDYAVFLEAFLEYMAEVPAFRELEQYAAGQGKSLRELGEAVWSACHRVGEVRGIFDQQHKLIAFTFYMRLSTVEREEPDAYAALFTAPFPALLLERMLSLGDDMLYLLGIGVDPLYRRQGIAKCLIADLMERYPGYGIMADVSGTISLPMYQALGFTIEPLPGEHPYFFVYRDAVSDQPNSGLL